MKQKLTLTTKESQDVLEILIEHQKNYGTDHTPERIIRIRGVIEKLTSN
jgi:hypothetical protein